jgi:hypothetical protein
MKIINLEEAYKLLEGAHAVQMQDNHLVYPSMFKLTGNDDNEFMRLSDGYSLRFLEKNNRKVRLNHVYMIMRANNMDIRIIILEPKKLE